VFSLPPIATVGLSEPAAVAQHGREHLRVYTTRFTSIYHAVTRRKPSTAMKLITLGPEERVIGLHAIGHGADEMVQGFAVAMKAGATKSVFEQTVAVHPTSAEEFVTMRG
jgi:glutathione reductase (NADPH)